MPNKETQSSAASPWAGPGGRQAQPTLFQARLEPHRSLGPVAFRRLMIGVLVLSLVPGFIFWLNGAWPVVGFLGLDVLALYYAFRASYRAGRMFEEVHLTQSELSITRVLPGGQKKSWVLEPYWARIELSQRGEHSCNLAVVCRMERVTLGAFLAPEERVAFADTLNEALMQRKTARGY